MERERERETVRKRKRRCYLSYLPYSARGAINFPITLFKYNVYETSREGEKERERGRQRKTGRRFDIFDTCQNRLFHLVLSFITQVHPRLPSRFVFRAHAFIKTCFPFSTD